MVSEGRNESTTEPKKIDRPDKPVAPHVDEIGSGESNQYATNPVAWTPAPAIPREGREEQQTRPRLLALTFGIPDNKRDLSLAACHRVTCGSHLGNKRRGKELGLLGPGAARRGSPLGPGKRTQRSCAQCSRCFPISFPLETSLEVVKPCAHLWGSPSCSGPRLF